MSDPHDVVIGQLYEAAAGLLPWPTALAALNTVFGAMVIQYVTFDKDTGQLIGCEQPDGVAVDAVLEYVREYNRIDPHTQRMERLPLGTVFDTAEAFPPARMVNHPFYRDFWGPYGVRGMLGGKIDDSEHHFSCIGIVRHVTQPAYTKRDLALVARFTHHLATALKVARHFKKLQITARLGTHLMEHAERPMMLVANDRRLLFANDEARRYLEDGQVLTLRDGLVKGRLAASDRSFRNCLNQVATHARARSSEADASPTGARAALRLAGVGGRLALCTLWDVDPERTARAFGDETAVLMSIAHPLMGQPPDAAFVAAMLDLTPAEARLASLLAAGQDPESIARSGAVSINTVRAQLKSIYAKTGTRRQPELVRLVDRVCAP